MSETFNRKTLSSLLSAITSSIVEAQQQMEQVQIANFLTYFEKYDGEKGLLPCTLDLALPSMRPNAEAGERDLYQTPYLSLLPHSGLRIEKTEVEFSVSLNGVALSDVDADKGVSDEKELTFSSVDELPDLQIDLNGNWGKSKDLSAKFKFVVSSVDLPEGTMRMIDQVGKTNQGYVGALGFPGKEMK